jgi:hypothetical protein
MSHNSKNAGLGERPTDSTIPAPKKVNAAGGSSQRVEEHDQNRFGAPVPSSFTHHIDSQVAPYVTHEEFMDSDGQHRGTIVHDHSPAPAALGHEPVKADDAKTLEYDSATNSHKPVKEASTGGVVRTTGAIGNHYH